MTGAVISESIVVDAPPSVVFAILADPRQHARIDGSGTVQALLEGPERLSKGATFGVRMRLGAPYTIKNTVVEFEEGRRIGWRHFGRHIWRYELEPVEGGTKVTETFDWGPALSPRLLERTGAPAKNLTSIEATLQRLDTLVTGGAD